MGNSILGIAQAKFFGVIFGSPFYHILLLNPLRSPFVLTSNNIHNLITFKHLPTISISISATISCHWVTAIVLFGQPCTYPCLPTVCPLCSSRGIHWKPMSEEIVSLLRILQRLFILLSES